jgi:hypothetical protein
MHATTITKSADAAAQVVFRVGVALLLSAQEQLLGMPFERLVEGLNGRKFPLLARHPDALMKVCGTVLRMWSVTNTCYAGAHQLP